MIFFGTLNTQVWGKWKGAYWNVEQHVFTVWCVHVIPKYYANPLKPTNDDTNTK